MSLLLCRRIELNQDCNRKGRIAAAFFPCHDHWKNPDFVSVYAALYKFVTAFRTEFSVRNYFCSTGWAEIQLFLRLLVIDARRLRIQYKLNDYPFRPAPSGKIISSVIDNLLNCINQGGNASVLLFSLKKVIDIGNRKSELSADIIQPEPLLKLRLNYYSGYFYLASPCNIQMKFIFTNNFLVE